MVYLAHPRTASRATSEALVQQAGFIKQVKPRSQIGDHEGIHENIPDDWIVFTTVRNHFDTLVSWYFHKNPRPSEKPPFDKGFIQRSLATCYFPILDRMWGMHRPLASHVLRYERLDAELNALLEYRGLGPVELPELGVSENRQNRSYRIFYDEPAREYVEDRFHIEMAELNYSW